MGDEQLIGADQVARKQFATAFRGFDQYEVRAFLAQVAAELASLYEREKSLRERLAAAEEKPAPKELVTDDLEAALGAEMGRVLHAAREAAAEIRARAEESVARMLKEANDEATHLRSAAESVLARRTEEAEEAASAILAAAESAAETARAEADAAATSAVEEAQQRGREMVAEAQVVRERILKDLSRRRKIAATQLEQLRAGRERLLSAYEVVRTTLEEATGELSVAEAEARLAAEAAGYRAPPESDDEAAIVETAPEPTAAEPAPGAEPEPVAASAASAAETAPEPDEVAPEPPEDERRSSSLRLLRRKPDVANLPPLEDELEGVRIIRPEPAGPEPTPMPRPIAVPDAAHEHEHEPEPVAEAEPAPALAEAESDQPAPADAEPVPTEEPVAEDAKPVENLFARLRADRAAAVAQAEVVLAEAASTPDLHNGTGPATAVTDAAEDIDAAADVDAEPEPTAAEAAFEARDAALDSADRALTRSLKRALSDEQNEVLDTLRRLRGTPKLDLLLPSGTEHVARFAAVAEEHLRAGAAAGAASVEGATPDVDALASALATEITDDLRGRLERTLDASSADEEALVEAISATYREWKTARSEPLARHHTAAAYALGVFVAAPADELQWVVDAAEGACPDCDDNALAGPTAKGSVYPTGQEHPPAHAGCRCLVLPVGPG